jgi:CO/xanthine dehydrogenase FAD-binding subunit
VFSLRDIVQPESLAEAYELLMKQKTNTVLGGCAFLRLGSKRIGTGIDLSKLNLDHIKEREGFIEIGAMVSFRDLETHSVLREAFDGMLPKAVGNIIGVQFRNGVTVGGSVFPKYGFSDLITALLALDTEVELYKAGRMSLREFLDKPFQKDILTSIRIRKEERRASYQNLRISASDYPVLTVAASRAGAAWKIVVGARPQKAQLAERASEELTELTLAYFKAQNKGTDTILDSNFFSDLKIDSLAERVVQELNFGTNSRGSAVYRKAVSKALVQRAIKEVLTCKSN